MRPRKGSERQPSALEFSFKVQWDARRFPNLDSEFRFAPPRKWRFDFAHPASRVAIEIEGGVWSAGRHTRGSGFVADAEKYNTAASLGWLVFRLAGADMVNDEKQLDQIAKTIRLMEPPK